MWLFVLDLDVVQVFQDAGWLCLTLGESIYLTTFQIKDVSHLTGIGLQSILHQQEVDLTRVL